MRAAAFAKLMIHHKSGRAEARMPAGKVHRLNVPGRCELTGTAKVQEMNLARSYARAAARTRCDFGADALRLHRSSAVPAGRRRGGRAANDASGCARVARDRPRARLIGAPHTNGPAEVQGVSILRRCDVTGPANAQKMNLAPRQRSRRRKILPVRD